jgi:hypothetical protein
MKVRTWTAVLLTGGLLAASGANGRVVAPKKTIELSTLRSLAITAICAVAINPLADYHDEHDVEQPTGDDNTSLGVKLRAD